MSARLRRLAADYERIRDNFTGHPYIEVKPVSGNPPERYVVTYRVPGLKLDGLLRRPTSANLHRVEIYLGAEYPRGKPVCKMLTPVFHPNFGSWICIGDHWAAGETLVDVIVKIGNMIQYRDYNTRSALNLQAARWAEANRHRLPIGRLDLYPKEPDIILRPASRGDFDVDIVLR